MDRASSGASLALASVFSAAVVRDQRVFGCQTAFVLIIAFGSADGVLEGFPNRNLLILVFVRGRALQGLEKIIIENDVVAFLAASGRRDNDSILTRKLLQPGAACRRRGDDDNSTDAECCQQLVVVVRCVVGTEDIELILPVLAAAVSDHEKEERILRLELLLQRGEGLLDFGLSGLLIDQNNDVIGRKAKLLEQSLLGPRCPFRELRFMFRAARYSSENEGTGVGKSCCRKAERE